MDSKEGLVEGFRLEPIDAEKVGMSTDDLQATERRTSPPPPPNNCSSWSIDA